MRRISYAHRSHRHGRFRPQGKKSAKKFLTPSAFTPGCTTTNPATKTTMHCHNADQTFYVIDGECTMHFPRRRQSRAHTGHGRDHHRRLVLSAGKRQRQTDDHDGQPLRPVGKYPDHRLRHAQRYPAKGSGRSSPRRKDAPVPVVPMVPGVPIDRACRLSVIGTVWNGWNDWNQRSLERVKFLRIVVTDFPFRASGISSRSTNSSTAFFMLTIPSCGKVGSPEQTFVAEQFQVTAGGHLLAALEINLPALDQFCRRQRLAHAVAHLAHEIRHPTAAGFKKGYFQIRQAAEQFRKT